MTDIHHGPWRLIDWDPALGRMLWVAHEDGKVHYRVDYVIDDLVRSNAEARTDSAGRRHGEWERIASMPLNFFYDSGLAQAMAEGDRKYTAKILNDSDYRAWRTKESKV